MYTTINQYDFTDNSTIRQKYSFDGALALFNYLEEYESDTGEKLEFDPIAIACDFTEYANLEELQEDYHNIVTMDDLQEETTVIPIEGTNGFIIQNF